MDLNFEIWAVDQQNHKEALIGTCLLLGVAKVWAKDATLNNDIEIRSKSSGQRWIYKKGAWRE